ncbi:MAG: CRISPR-associated protein [Nodularia sp. (in: Bacteria)]|nr:MAG: CRISPR-associated protein [Nodularia sp. (in: cyanobacteria)]
MFRYLIIIRPLGFLYGSSGAFLSPENLVGRSGEKFPPSAATLSGVFFSANWGKEEIREELKEHLYTAGPFWAKSQHEQDFYVPIPWHKIIAEQETDEWVLDKQRNWQRQRTYKEDEDKLEPTFTWQTISSWNHGKPQCAKHPWEYTSILHPRMQDNHRQTLSKDGLFLENAVAMPEDYCLVYLSTHELPNGWYRFGGEKHIVEIETKEIKKPQTLKLLKKEIQQAFALITPGLWGSNRLSYRLPQHPEFINAKLLTDKPIPSRYSAGGKLGRGRYAVPPGSVYVLEKPLNLSWFDFPNTWFSQEGYSSKKLGCGLCLPIEIKGLPTYQGVA